MEKESKKDDIKVTGFEPVKMRQIIIETDGNKVEIIKAEVAGSFEFKAILQGILENIK